MSLIQEGDIRVDVRSATSATRDDLVLHNRNGILIIVERAVGLDDERKRQLGLLEEGMCCGNSVEGRPEISRGTVGIRGRSDARLVGAS
jgi:hypothetical protein